MTKIKKFDLGGIVSTQCSTMNAGKPPSVIGVKEKSKKISKRRELITDTWIGEHKKWLRYIGRRVYKTEEQPPTKKKVDGKTRKEYKVYTLRVRRMMRRAKELAWYEW